MSKIKPQIQIKVIIYIPLELAHKYAIKYTDKILVVKNYNHKSSIIAIYFSVFFLSLICLAFFFEKNKTLTFTKKFSRFVPRTSIKSFIRIYSSLDDKRLLLISYASLTSFSIFSGSISSSLYKLLLFGAGFYLFSFTSKLGFPSMAKTVLLL